MTISVAIGPKAPTAVTRPVATRLAAPDWVIAFAMPSPAPMVMRTDQSTLWRACVAVMQRVPIKAATVTNAAIEMWIPPSETANTMAAMAEALGMTFPGNTTVPGADSQLMRYAFRAGQQVVHLQRSDMRPADVMTPAAFRNAIRLLMAVPTILHRLVEASDREPDPRLSGLRAVISGSAPLAPSLFARFQQRFGLEPMERYGMTETLMNAANPAHGARKPGSVGPAVPGVELRISGGA